ncbi:hypothetical protein HOC01_02415 [archaeon]|jgi:hypothetical protein|nr:hypothetical protein [archaeon]MBT6697828.1 hypothetical protein [archaeon]
MGNLKDTLAAVRASRRVLNRIKNQGIATKRTEYLTELENTKNLLLFIQANIKKFPHTQHAVLGTISQIEDEQKNNSGMVRRMFIGRKATQIIANLDLIINQMRHNAEHFEKQRRAHIIRTMELNGVSTKEAFGQIIAILSQTKTQLFNWIIQENAMAVCSGPIYPKEIEDKGDPIVRKSKKGSSGLGEMDFFVPSLHRAHARFIRSVYKGAIPTLTPSHVITTRFQQKNKLSVYASKRKPIRIEIKTVRRIVGIYVHLYKNTPKFTLDTRASPRAVWIGVCPEDMWEATLHQKKINVRGHTPAFQLAAMLLQIDFDPFWLIKFLREFHFDMGQAATRKSKINPKVHNPNIFTAWVDSMVEQGNIGNVNKKSIDEEVAKLFH